MSTKDKLAAVRPKPTALREGFRQFPDRAGGGVLSSPGRRVSLCAASTYSTYGQESVSGTAPSGPVTERRRLGSPQKPHATIPSALAEPDPSTSCLSGHLAS